MKKLQSIFIALTLFTAITSSTPAFADPAVPLDPKQTVGAVSNVYNLLAPIGIGKLQVNCIDTTGTDKNCASGGIGDYFNIIFQISIGICGVLAVIMIVIGGIQYMGEESVFGKTEAKSRILNAVLGLLIAIGSYALLNTINPDLLGGKGLSVSTVTAEIDPPMEANDTPPPSGVPVAQCPEGIISVATSGGVFPVCKPLGMSLKLMIDTAWSSGYKISGYGFRSKEKQISLRTQNCGGAQNVYNANAKCNPDTALPGTSMHESGKAFDLKCDGATIKAKDNKCYVWLKSNASKYGLSNLLSEPWHWSTTGH